MKLYEIPTVIFLQLQPEDVISTSLQEGISDDEMELSFPNIFE